MTNREKIDAVMAWSDSGPYIEAEDLIEGKSDLMVIDGHTTVADLKELIKILES